MLSNPLKRMVWICAFVIILMATAAQAKAGKEGMVLHAANKAGFIFIDLGEKDVKPGDLVEIYRHSEYQATFVIKEVRGSMSEAWAVNTDKKVAINTGDRAIIPESGQAAVSAPYVAEPPREPEPEFLIKEQERPSSFNDTLLTGELNSLQSENARLLSELMEAQRQKDDISANLNNELINIKRMNSDTQNKLREVATSLGGDNDSLRRQVSELIKAKQEAESRLAGLAKDKDELEAKLASQAAVIARAKGETESRYKEDVQKLQKQKAEIEAKLSSQISFLEKEKSSLNSQLASLNKDKDSLDQKLRQDIAN
ncbi:MAG: hypothetical protein WC569_04245, partial [Candidatus Omnitrophota bacterium]